MNLERKREINDQKDGSRRRGNTYPVTTMECAEKMERMSDVDACRAGVLSVNRTNILESSGAGTSIVLLRFP